MAGVLGQLAEESVTKALVDFTRQTIAAGQLAGGVYGQALPDNGGYPAAVWKYPKTIFQYGFEGLQTERPLLHLEVYAIDSGLAEKLCRQLANQVGSGGDNGNLPFTTTQSIQLYPRDLYHVPDVQKGPGGLSYYGTRAEFELWLVAK